MQKLTYIVAFILLILLGYWFFNKPSESLQPIPDKAYESDDTNLIKDTVKVANIDTISKERSLRVLEKCKIILNNEIIRDNVPCSNQSHWDHRATQGSKLCTIVADLDLADSDDSLLKDAMDACVQLAIVEILENAE